MTSLFFDVVLVMRLILIIKFSQFVFGGGGILIHAFLYLGDIT